MLESFLLKNFQTHQTIQVDLDQVTTFVGDNVTGKSSLFRGLEYVCLNQPRGYEEYLRHGSPYLLARLNVDGHTIKRKRGKGHNLYSLDGNKWPVIGQAGNVPSEIAKLLNVGSINFQGQHANAFWFSSSPTEVGKELNRIVNLEVIDQALELAKQRVKEWTTTETTALARLTHAKAKRDQYAYVLELDERLKEIEQLDEQIEEKAALLKSMQQTCVGVQMMKKRAGELTLAIKAGRKLRKLCDTRKEEKCLALTELIDRYEENDARLQTIVTKQDAVRSKLNRMRKGKCPLCSQTFAGS